MKKYLVIFMGTPIFAASILLSLLKLKEIEVVGVITQPDKKIGREQKIIFSPVKKNAIKNNLLILQPNKIIESYDKIKKLNPDIILTCAYGQFIPNKILKLPKINALNIHASLLPRLRGGAPINKAIIYGETETGISIIKIIMKMDAGKIYYQNKTSISLRDTATTLHNKLILLAKDIIKNHFIKIIEGKYLPIEQDNNLVTFAYNITREEEKINWNKSLLNIYNQIRGLYFWPIAYAILNNKIYKIHSAKMLDDQLNTEDQKLTNGTIVALTKTGIKIKVINGYLLITKLQKEGKSANLTNSYYNNPTNEIKVNNYFE